LEDQPGRTDQVPSEGTPLGDSEQARRRRERQATRERELAERRAARRRGGAPEGADADNQPDVAANDPAQPPVARAEAITSPEAAGGHDAAAGPTPAAPAPAAAGNAASAAAAAPAAAEPAARPAPSAKVVPLRPEETGGETPRRAAGRADDRTEPPSPRRLSLRAVPDEQPAARPTPPVASPKPGGARPPAPAVAPPAARPSTAPAAQPRPRVPLAGPAGLRPRHIVMLSSFVLGVILPSVLVAWYMWAVALDQYASKVGFSVQRDESGSAVELLGGITELSGSSSTDTDILYKYIQSRELIETVNARLNLVDMFTRPEDPLYTMPPNPTIEDIEAHWGRVVKVFYDTASFLIEVRVVAFRPEDSRAITELILAESTRTLNDLAAAGRADATRYAREELEVSKSRLRDARQALTTFRVRNQIVDPAADVQGRMGLMNSLLSQQATALIELDLVAATAGPGDPRYIQAQRRVDVIEARLREERARFGDQPAAEDERYADIVAEFEALSVDLEFAQQAYLTSLATYDAAVAEAQRKSRYLATYLPPTLAERAEFPSRLLVFALAAGAFFSIWSIAVLVYYTLRDRV
jgi:capsular polysaccharide transport system permease protein